jgi:hypothetical protein
MESELLRTELQNVRNHLTTLARNIDNTLLTHNTSTRERTRTAARRNLNNLFSELRNLYPYSNTTYNDNLNSTNTNNTQINENLNQPLRNPYSNLFTNPEMIEVTLNTGRRTVNHMEDVQVYPSLRTLRESSTIHIYRDLDTSHEMCSICRDNFDEYSVVRRLGCEHIFHIGCIDTWFETNIRCPLCRIDLRDSENDNEPETEPT